MKNIICLIAILTFIGCKVEQPNEFSIITGKVENNSEEKIFLRGFDFKEEVMIDSNGVFLDTIEEYTGLLDVFYGRKKVTMHIVKGSIDTINFDANKFDESLKLLGSNSMTNQYLLEKVKKEKELVGDISALYSLEEEVFLAKMDSLNGVRVDMLKNAENIDATFRSMEEKELNFDHLSSLANYENYHQYFSKNDTFKASDALKSKFNTINMDDEENYKMLPSYRNLVDSYYGEYMYGDDMKAGIAKLKEITSPAIKKSLAQNFAYSLSPGNEENESLFNTLTAMRSDTAFVNKLTKKYEVLKKLVKGEKSPQFENYKNFDGTITSLNDLTGKYVYVDVWATWCGPCKAEIPYLKEVEEKYHGKNIQFVSISVDKAEDEDKWKTMVTDKELGGIQLFADNDWNSKFVKDYAIEGIPRFILIDTEGNIVTGDAPRPSDDKLIQLFTELGI